MNGMKKWLRGFAEFLIKRYLTEKATTTPSPSTVVQKEFTFIWYKRMQAGGKTIFTQPFRTTVKAAHSIEAKQKMIEFAMGKMKLMIIPEEDFGKTDLAAFNKRFEDMNTKMEEMFSKFENMV